MEKPDSHKVSSADFWNELYKSDQAGWDLGTPTPVFSDLIARRSFAPGNILILGCGKGYDAVEFAQAGFAVTAIDFSEEAIKIAESMAREMKVAIDFLCEDIFTIPSKYQGRFDYVLEYVTYCAIDPGRRKEFASVVSRLLKPGGIFIGLFFPLDGRAGGPPFAVSMEEVRADFAKYLALESETVPARSISPRRGKEMLTIWKNTQA